MPDDHQPDVMSNDQREIVDILQKAARAMEVKIRYLNNDLHRHSHQDHHDPEGTRRSEKPEPEEESSLCVVDVVDVVPPKVTIHMDKKGTFFLSTNVRELPQSTYSSLAETLSSPMIGSTSRVPKAAVWTAKAFESTTWHDDLKEPFTKVAKLLNEQARLLQTDLESKIPLKESQTHLLRQVFQGLQLNTFETWRVFSGITNKEWETSDLHPDVLFPKAPEDQTSEDRVKSVVVDLKGIWAESSVYTMLSHLQKLQKTIGAISNFLKSGQGKSGQRESGQESLISPEEQENSEVLIRLTRKRCAEVEAAKNSKSMTSAGTRLKSNFEKLDLPSNWSTWSNSINDDLVLKLRDVKDHSTLTKVLRESWPDFGSAMDKRRALKDKKSARKQKKRKEAEEVELHPKNDFSDWNLVLIGRDSDRDHRKHIRYTSQLSRRGSDPLQHRTDYALTEEEDSAQDADSAQDKGSAEDEELEEEKRRRWDYGFYSKRQTTGWRRTGSLNDISPI